MLTPIRKVIVVFYITILALIICLPKEVPVNLGSLGLNFKTTIKRPDINFSIGRNNFSKNLDLVLGLDLSGGSHLVFEADTSELDEAKISDAIDSVRNVIERRVNLFGVSEPNVLTSSFEGKDRIIVELPGVRDTNQAIDIIGQTAQLSFAEVGEGEEAALIPTELTGADLESATVVFDQTSGKPAVSLDFTTEGSDKFAQITERNIQKPLPILLDGIPISSPVVQETISGGSAQITGDFTLEQAKSMAIQLNAGALPVGVKLVEQRTVGATLGKESVEKSITAGVIGLAMVLLFMVLSYGKFGLIADLALIVFGIFTLAIYKLIPVVLTLPGIAGFLLSVGMAVDSNILIFERFKEEIQKRSYSDALEVSFGRAWDSIRDANIATLLAAFVLANPLELNFLHTSGPVRGFAITLSIGIAISLFTGIVVSRNLLRVFLTEKKDRS